ncbi:MAG: thiamine diphosphokinase [Weeksellaceae bacterium]
MKTALIAVNGNLSHLPKLASLIDEQTIVIAADGGAQHLLDADITPNVVIGDMDSLSATTLRELHQTEANIQQYPREKDYTDTELALKYALAIGCTSIKVIGFLGDRLDHMWANIAHLATQIPAEVDLIIYEKNQQLSFIFSTKTFHGKKGDELSLIPLHEDCTDITTTGLQYKLDNELLPYGTTRGVSNVFETEEVTVELKKGMLMAIHRTM